MKYPNHKKLADEVLGTLVSQRMTSLKFIGVEEAIVLADAFGEAAIALRTNRDTQVVRKEAEFLHDPNVSASVKIRYHTLKERQAELKEFIR